MSDRAETPSVREPFNAIEIRILGCLIEKQATTPESYPLTLNALVLACNQKSSREPLMSLASGQVGQGLRQLEGRSLVELVMGSRADRWEHRLDKALQLTPPQLSLIGLLLLRGPQTVSELLTRSARLYAFDDGEELQHQLERLIGRELVCRLPRQPGQREERYMHQLGSAEDLEELLAARATQAAVNEGAGGGRIEALEARIAELETRLAKLEEDLGSGEPRG
ncbi:YceH family protein [Azorhizophilus paspali]|uniref:YceH family protein n=1 Tax=Azorhizophilus paspali TaxID=69963 RepID=A0ABV6SPP9_AZOPA